MFTLLHEVSITNLSNLLRLYLADTPPIPSIFQTDISLKHQKLSRDAIPLLRNLIYNVTHRLAFIIFPYPI